MDNDKKNSVLVVDDETLNLKVLNSILSSEYTIYMAKNGLSAIEMANEYSPDLILLDIIMPDISGFEVLAALKGSEKTRSIPVIIITGLESIEDEEKGLTLEAADFIHKPFSSKIIKLKVRNQIQIINQFHELVKLHKDLEVAVKAAETANHAKSAFLARMSHEIRTPLNAVLGISEIQLQNENLIPETKEAFTRIFNSGDLLLSIINDILDMSKIEAGKLELALAQYDISSLMNDTIFLNMIKYENKPIEFILNVDENVPAQLFGDELRIKQILNNLLSNAFKYTHTGKVELSLEAEKLDDIVMLIFRVRDTGQGLTDEQLSKLFDEYSRFNIETNRTTEGTGLGMGITQNLIHMMNGDILAESTHGIGSLFTVRLPQGDIGSPALGKEAVEKLQQFRLNFETKMKNVQIVHEPIPFGKILVVDDMEMNLYVAKGMLSRYGLQIDTATSGYEAIDKIKQSAYDLVFMDHMMPTMDGMEATCEIRKMGSEYEKLPIIALTANAISGMKEMFLANGFNGYISKPIITQELDDILKTWMSPEKITQQAKPETGEDLSPDAATTPANEIDDVFLDNVRKISKINTDIGLSHLSDKVDIYRNTLGIFHKKLVSECNNMTVSLDSKDIQKFRISIHAMKSMLAIIGASVLSESAYKLEIASANQEIDYCTQEFPTLKEQLLLLHNKLSVIYNNDTEEKETAYLQKNIRSEKILLVDDMDMILYVVKEKLSHYGLQVDTTTSGPEAIEKIKNNKYDLVFMDHMMPEMDGIETTCEIRKLGTAYEKLPIIALTANKDPGMRDVFLTNGLNDYMTKPVVTQKLEEILKKWLPDF
ncbi:MAG: response regulator [Treponema sp.]|nr:response regulator [Treponema sp.]